VQNQLTGARVLLGHGIHHAFMVELKVGEGDRESPVHQHLQERDDMPLCWGRG
jgi:hypothetical protein